MGTTCLLLESWAMLPQSIVLGLLITMWIPTGARAQARPPFLSNDPGTPGIQQSNYGWQSHCRGLFQTPIPA
jgi:hypothetical protein